MAVEALDFPVLSAYDFSDSLHPNFIQQQGGSQAPVRSGRNSKRDRITGPYEEESRMEWVWYFSFYSFLGFLLETGYAWWTGGELDRKCLLLLPLCPVYGLGACAVLLLPGTVLRSPPLLMIVGGLTATAVEYAVSVFYQKAFSVSFWDYHGQIGNLNGRVCLPFTLAWGLLLLPMVYLIQPAAAQWFSAVPLPVSWAFLSALAADLAVSAVILRHTGDRACLQWYRTAGRPQ